MERETKKLKTPLEKEVELKTYLNTREILELRSVILEDMKIDTKKGTPASDQVSGKTAEKAERKLLELAVVSYDGSKENIIERLLDAPLDEYVFVLNEANSLKSSNFPQAK